MKTTNNGDIKTESPVPGDLVKKGCIHCRVKQRSHYICLMIANVKETIYLILDDQS